MRHDTSFERNIRFGKYWTYLRQVYKSGKQIRATSIYRPAVLLLAVLIDDPPPLTHRDLGHALQPILHPARRFARPAAVGFEQPSAPLYIVGPCLVAVDKTPGTAWAHWKHDANVTLQQRYMDAARCPLPAARCPPASAAARRFALRQDTAGTTSSTHLAHRSCCPPAARACAAPPSFSYAGSPSHRPRIATSMHTAICIRRYGPSPHAATTPRLRRYAGNMRAHVTTTGASGVASGFLVSTSAMRTRDNAGHCHIGASASPFSHTCSQSSKDWGYGARHGALQHGCDHSPQMLPALKNHATEPQ
ncbi:hypothetical protein B0H19DRAFT_1332364 [Mycena capillaripes]|nr:hypothetical protein B0H19DRAFT_1332364 [Mycena capillaripes]